MSGQQEFTYSWRNRFSNLFNLAFGSYRNLMEQSNDPRSRMQNPDQELRTENLVTSYEAEKEELDRVYIMDPLIWTTILV